MSIVQCVKVCHVPWGAKLTAYYILYIRLTALEFGPLFIRS